MADNVDITAGTGTTIATDDVGGAHYQIVKLAWGANNTATLVAAANPVPVVQTGTHNVVVTNAGTFAVQADSVIPGTAATSLGKAVDSAVGATDTGVAALGVRIDIPADMTPAAGDYTRFRTDKKGSIWTASLNGGAQYETVAASQTAQALGASGATGDYIAGVLVVPATTSPGNVLLLDNAISITIFTGGATSVTNLVPFFIPLGLFSVSGAWKLTTGSNVSCIGIGQFT